MLDGVTSFGALGEAAGDEREAIVFSPRGLAAVGPWARADGP